MRSLLLTAGLLFSGLLNAAASVEACRSDSLNLMSVAQVFEDRQARMGLEDIVQLPEARFSAATADWPPQGYTHSAFWLRLELKNGASTTCSRWLTVGAPRLEDIRVYKVGAGGWKLMRAGSAYPLKQWPYPTRQALFPMSLASGESAVLLIRVASGTQMLINPELWSETARFQHRQASDLWDGITLGIVCLVTLFSLMVGAIFRSRLVVVHAGAVSSYILLTCVLNGYLVFWPAALGWTRELTALAGMASFACFLGYVAVVLRVGQLPRIIGALFGLQFALYASARLWSLFDPVQGGDAALVAMKGIYVLLPLALLVGWRKGIRYDWLAWLLLAYFTLMFAARYFLELSDIPWQSPRDRLSLPSTLPGVALLVCTLIVEVSRAKTREKRALLDLDHLKQAEHERLEQTVALRTQQLRDSLQARSALMARISHDLRSPLVSIIDYARLLRTQPNREYPANIERNARQQLELIDELLEFSRGELEQMELTLAPGYLYGFLREIEEEAGFLASRQGNTFEVALSDDLPALVQADFKRLRQILMNLLANAAKFTHNGRIRFEVDCRAGEMPETVELIFSVSDTGIGIDPAEHEQLFQPFHRGRNAQRYDGTGLGLSIVSQLLQRMSSQLELEAVEQGGSRFSFRLLLEFAQEQELDSGLADNHTVPFDGQGRHILVVDDVEQNREWLYDLLAGYGFDVSLAATGEDALVCLDEQSVDLLISDQMMPGMDGWELLRQVRSRWQRLPVMLYSAAPARRPKDYSDTLAFDAVLLKPAGSSDMLACIETLTCHAVTARHTVTQA